MNQFSAESAVTSDARFALLNKWLVSDLEMTLESIEPASADASFRRYFRLYPQGSNLTFIAMDAPPDVEKPTTFVAMARLLHGAGIHVPEIIAENAEQGFLLLSDLGTLDYQRAVRKEDPNPLYQQAIDTLLRIQGITPPSDLPVYDEAFLRREMQLFSEWFIAGLLDTKLSALEQTALSKAEDHLVQSALAQPQVLVHRDYHSRNLMRTQVHNPGVLDFQDAVLGPITYDLVSLLKDSYTIWSESERQAWLEYYLQQATNQGVLPSTNQAQFVRWFDLMGAQRQLKICGIFSRLKLRDGKAHYLADLPPTLNYLCEVAQRYEDLAELLPLLKRCQTLLAHQMPELSTDSQVKTF